MTADADSLTRDFENWLGSRLPVVDADVQLKHAEMVTDVFRFLRGSYYLWLLRCTELLPELVVMPRVPSVGDVHIENYGTWRDREGCLRWGVNDLDELCVAAWPLDLVRLATSAVIASHISLSDKEICRVVLEEWHTALPQTSLDLSAPGASHVRRLVPPEQAEHAYFDSLVRDPEVHEGAVPASVRVAAAASVDSDWKPHWHARTAGTGSLGRPRYCAVAADAAGRWHAREVKELGPHTTQWARGHVDPGALPSPDDELYDPLQVALSGPVASRRVDGWQLRRLAPDTRRVRLAKQSESDARLLLTSMTRACVDVHGSAPDRFLAARTSSGVLSPKDFHNAVRVMVDSTTRDHKVFQRGFS
jgi:hypothetical protein